MKNLHEEELALLRNASFRKFRRIAIANHCHQLHHFIALKECLYPSWILSVSIRSKVLIRTWTPSKLGKPKGLQSGEESKLTARRSHFLSQPISLFIPGNFTIIFSTN